MFATFNVDFLLYSEMSTILYKLAYSDNELLEYTCFL